MNITEKVSYIKGLLEGLNLDENKAEVKLISAIVDLLDDMALEVTDVEEELCELTEQVNEIDEDLGCLEDEVYDCDDACDCDCCSDDEFYEVTCPTCGKTVCISDTVLCDGSMDCPNCGENLEFDFDDICNEDGCECGCGHTDCKCD